MKPGGQRKKGARTELALVHLLQEAGFAAEKISRSGYEGCDLSWPIAGVDRKVEVKARANGFQMLYRWLLDADMLILKGDRQRALLVLPLAQACEFAKMIEANHEPRPNNAVVEDKA